MRMSDMTNTNGTGTVHCTLCTVHLLLWMVRFVVEGNNQGSEIVVQMREGAEGKGGAKVAR